MKCFLALVVGCFFSFGVETSWANSEKKLQEFETDYCTFFFDGTFSKPQAWRSCCYEHDLRYWFGGTSYEEERADKRIQTCVAEKAGSFYANLIYYAIRTGHYSPIKHKYKWGWGWSDSDAKEPYQKLSNEDKEIVKNALKKLNLEEEFLTKFRKNNDL